MVFCVGLTGSIASGKSTVSAFFADFGADVISADKIALALTEINQPAYAQIVEHFGSDVVHHDGSINRKRLREIIFAQPEQRKWLEELLHPLIREQIAMYVEQSKKIYCVIEIPLLLDKSQYPYLNQILVVTAPQEVQIKRVIERDQCTREQALAILEAQPQLSQHLQYANDIIINDLNLAELKQAVEHLHHKYLQQIN